MWNFQLKQKDYLVVTKSQVHQNSQPIKRNNNFFWNAYSSKRPTYKTKQYFVEMRTHRKLCGTGNAPAYKVKRANFHDFALSKRILFMRSLYYQHFQDNLNNKIPKARKANLLQEETYTKAHLHAMLDPCSRSNTIQRRKLRQTGKPNGIRNLYVKIKAGVRNNYSSLLPGKHTRHWRWF